MADKNYSKTSGAAKRRRAKEIHELNKIPKISSFFARQDENEVIQVENEIATTSTSVSESESEYIPKTPHEIDKKERKSDQELVTESSELEERSVCLCKETVFESLKNSELTYKIKQLVISLEPCKPNGPFPKDVNQDNRSFSENYYKVKTAYGYINRTWLCYSAGLDVVYCNPCWLFSSSSNWTEGIRTWKNLSLKISVHENSRAHINACCINERCKKNNTIDKDLEDKIRSETNFWRQVLERLVNITILLAKNSLPFRGHRKNFEDNFNRVFLQEVKLLSRYDLVMKEVLNKGKGQIRYLSPTIQNELINTIGIYLEKKLVEDIKSAPFYAIVMDTTQDINKVDQLSHVYRYIDIERNSEDIPISIKIRETFLGYLVINDRSATAVTNTIYELLQKHKINLNKCRGQGFNGANVMSGLYNAVQQKIREIQPNAEYVHCASHNLNLVINDCIKNSKEADTFFVNLGSIYKFFGYSLNRWETLASFTEESTTTIKRLNPTRWSGRVTSLLAVKLRYVDILKALTEIALKSTKKEERNEAKRIKNMTNFQFVFLCTFLFKLLNEVNITSKLLQSKEIDLEKASIALKTTTEALIKLRESFNECKNEAKKTADKWGVPDNFIEKRISVPKKFFDEQEHYVTFNKAEDNFRIKVFFKILDVSIVQIKSRFNAMQKIVDNFYFLNPVKLTLTLTEENIVTFAENLQKIYSNDLRTNFPIQLV